MIEGSDTVDDYEEDIERSPVEADMDPVSLALGSSVYVARYTHPGCVESYDNSSITRFPDTFDRYYFETSHGRVLVDLLHDLEGEPATDRQTKHVSFKQGWCGDHGITYLALNEQDMNVSKIRRMLNPVEPPPAKSAPVTEDAPVKRRPGRPKGSGVQRPKSAAA